MNIYTFLYTMYMLLFSRSVVSDSLWRHGLQHARLPSLQNILELAQTHVCWVGDAIQPFYPLCHLLFLPLIFPSIRVFSNESAVRIRWPKYWSFSTSPSDVYSGLISFKIDSFDVCVYIYRHTLFPVFFHYGLSQAVDYSSLCCTVGCCLSILYIRVFNIFYLSSCCTGSQLWCRGFHCDVHAQ